MTLWGSVNDIIIIFPLVYSHISNNSPKTSSSYMLYFSINFSIYIMKHCIWPPIGPWVLAAGHFLHCFTATLVAQQDRPVNWLALEFLYGKQMVHFVGFVLLTAVVIKRSVFWDITPCSPLKANGRFEGTCRLRLQGGSIRQEII
jgi:hypothetical protein